MSKFTEVKIDRTTLPLDGAIVEYHILDEENEESNRYGVYFEKDDMFWSSPSEFYFTHDVVKWRMIEKPKK
jgi:hypothetical protein